MAGGDFDQEQLQKVLNDLPEEFRSPIVLFYFQELQLQEIAEQMEVPVGTIMSRLARRPKAYLRQRLTAPGPVAAGNRAFQAPATCRLFPLDGAEGEDRMNCLTAREILELASARRGGRERDRTAARHVESCPPCQTAVRRQEQLDEAHRRVMSRRAFARRPQENLLVRLEATPGGEALAAGPAGAMAAIKLPLRSRRLMGEEGFLWSLRADILTGAGSLVVVARADFDKPSRK